ncbi:MAG: alpha/beta hydrolase [Desulfuromonadales bacterium]|nr:alpha/beta hydrolase [Desulfuromonadales bacterium]
MTGSSTVFFSHGKESGPWGTKITALAAIASERKFGVESIDYTDLPDPDDRVARLLDRVSRSGCRSPILVGSSMGAYVATVASENIRPAGLFLMAPALYLSGYACHKPVPCCVKTVIVHGWNDDIVPPGNSIRFAQEHQVELHLVRGDHQLSGNLLFVGDLFALFLKSLYCSSG